jgi:hypothetical protein
VTGSRGPSALCSSPTTSGLQPRRPVCREPTGGVAQLAPAGSVADTQAGTTPREQERVHEAVRSRRHHHRRRRAGLAAAPVPKDVVSLVIWSAPIPPKEGSRAGASGGAWTRDGKHVLTDGWVQPADGAPTSGEVRAWDAAAGKVVRAFRGTAAAYSTLAVSPDGRVVAAGGRASRPGEVPGGQIEVWDWDGNREGPRLRLGGSGLAVTGVAFSPDRTTLAAAGQGVEDLPVPPPRGTPPREVEAEGPLFGHRAPRVVGGHPRPATATRRVDRRARSWCS